MLLYVVFGLALLWFSINLFFAPTPPPPPEFAIDESTFELHLLVTPTMPPLPGF